MPELEPRLFSFNSPFGACPACQGLGEKLEVDPKLVIPNPNLSIAEGAIFPWARASHKVGRQGFFWWKLQELAEKYKFSLDVPVKELSKSVIDLILYGDMMILKAWLIGWKEDITKPILIGPEKKLNNIWWRKYVRFARAKD